MAPKLLLDTHIVVRWLADPRKLSRNQTRTLASVVRRAEPVALSAITLLEIAVLTADGRLRLKAPLDELLTELQANPVFQVLPLSYEVASEVESLGSVLRDPADRVIVATARVHRLRLMTSDQRIIESNLVAVIE
jgi:PIN domain nuclease of toxin-antitoxin system